MKTEIYVNNKFRFLSEFFSGLPERFESLGTEIYRGRNEVRIVEVDGLKLAIKYFTAYIRRLAPSTPPSAERAAPRTLQHPHFSTTPNLKADKVYIRSSYVPSLQHRRPPQP